MRLKSNLTKSILTLCTTTYFFAQIITNSSPGWSRPVKTGCDGQSEAIGKKTLQLLPRKTSGGKIDKRATLLLTIVVRNPHCPACLLSLQKFLGNLGGVSSVTLGSLKSKGPSATFKIKLTRPGSASPCDLRKDADTVLERVKTHDFEILSYFTTIL
jgi:hypothetical protein